MQLDDRFVLATVTASVIASQSDVIEYRVHVARFKTAKAAERVAVFFQEHGRGRSVIVEDI